MRLNYLIDKSIVTYFLMAMGSNVLKWLADKRGTVTHKLLVMGCDMIRQSGRKEALSLTSYWSWDEMWFQCLGSKKGIVTHKLFAMGCDGMRLSCRIYGTMTHSLFAKGYQA